MTTNASPEAALLRPPTTPIKVPGVKKEPWTWRRLTHRPETGALAGTLVVFIFFAVSGGTCSPGRIRFVRPSPMITEIAEKTKV